MSLFAERLPRPRHRALCSAEQGGAWRARILDENPGSWTSRPSGLSFLVCQMGTPWDCGGRKGDLTVTVLALCWPLGKRSVNTTCVIMAVSSRLARGQVGRSSGCPHAAPADARASQSQEEAVSRSPSGPEAGQPSGSAPRPPLGGGPPVAPVHTSRSSSADPGAHNTPEAWEWPAPLAEDQASRAVQWGEQAPPSRAGQHRGRCSASLNLGSLACDTEVVFPACRGGRRERMSLPSVRCLARDGGSAVGKTVLVLWVNSIRRGLLPHPQDFSCSWSGPRAMLPSAV